MIACSFIVSFVVLLLGALALACGEPVHQTTGLTAKCAISLKGYSSVVPCWRALFSPSNFRMQGEADFVFPNLCNNTDHQHRCNGAIKQIAVVNRGSCPFWISAENAAQFGYAALIIVNSADTLFSIGASNSSFESTIPVLALGKSAFSSFTTQADAKNDDFGSNLDRLDGEKTPILLSLRSPPSAKPPRTSAVEGACQRLKQGWMGAGIIVLISSSLLLSSNNHWPSLDSVSYVASAAIIVALFVAMRLPTLRRASDALVSLRGIEDSSLEDYHHFEVDELVYATLVDSVSSDWTQYHLLSSPILYRLQLPLENYGQDIFIHPPLFVYFSAALYSHFAVPLPLIPVLLQTVTLLAIGVLAVEVLRSTHWHDQRYSIALRSMLVFSLCPIAALCSQKFWLDNALLCAVALSIALHLWCSRKESPVWMFMSGLCFGGIVLNTKVTGWGLLPFLLLWRIRQRADMLRNSWGSALRDCMSLLLGALASHGPWLYLYKTRTGRWLPTAWPSAELQRLFPFVAQAVQRPWSHYFVLLARIHPAHFIGVVFIAVTLLSRQTFSAWKAVLFGSLSELPRQSNAHLLNITTFSLYPLSLLVGLSILGAVGGGFQARFLLPAVPGLSVMASIAFESMAAKRRGVAEALFACCCILATAHCIVYILASPLHADVDADVFQIVASILDSTFPGYQKLERGAIESLYRHFGLIRALQSLGE